MLSKLNPISAAHADDGVPRQSAVPVIPPSDESRDERAAKLAAAMGPNMSNRATSQGGRSFADVGVKLPDDPLIQRPVTEMSMIPQEDLLADQQLVRKLQAQTAAGIPYEATSDVGDAFPPEPPAPAVDQETVSYTHLTLPTKA